MPTKKRKARDAARLKKDEEWAKIRAEAPPHILPLLDQPSRLGDSLRAVGKHGVAWAKYDEYGNPLPRDDSGRTSANLDRKDGKKERALDMQKKYSDIWGKRGVAEGIAEAEGCSAETVLRYMRKFPT
jgi:hypothetical protein